MRSLRRHDDGGMDMDMDMGAIMVDMDDMDSGTISVTWFPQLYWIFIGCVVAAFALVNVVNHLLYRQRMWATARRQPNPARPRNLFTKTLAFATALIREIESFSLPSIPRRFHVLGWTPPTPPLGSMLLVFANAALLIILGFYRLDPTDYGNYQNIAYRWGFLTLAQLPLIFLLAGKESIIGFFTGHSYERLNWLHRWVARCMLLTATLHMAFWFRNWAPYDYIGYQMKNDTSFTRTGFGAWCVLLWIVLSSMAPIRNMAYEFFFVQHLLSLTAFITMVFIHTPVVDHAWLWVPVALFFFDRLVRTGWLVANNLFVHGILNKSAHRVKSRLTYGAEVTIFADNVIRLTIQKPLIRWKPGQHVFLSLPAMIPLQAHPFTIFSLPSDDKMEFFVQAQTGGTGRLVGSTSRLPTFEGEKVIGSTIPCAISKPYGKLRPLQQFDTVCLFAGGIGATFTMPLMRDIIRRWKLNASERKGIASKQELALTRRIRLIWVVKASHHIRWFSDRLHEAVQDVRHVRKEGLDVRLKISVYVTCDEAFTSEWSREAQAASAINPKAKLLEQPLTNDPRYEEKKRDSYEQNTTVTEVDPRADSLSSGTKLGRGCGPDGTCCCRSTVESERDAPAIVCTCCQTSDRLGDPVRELTKLKEVHVLSGRPEARTIVQSVLMQARGETGVVACGPQSLREGVRRSAVETSDEFAAGRKRGVQGVWFWGEGYGW